MGRGTCTFPALAMMFSVGGMDMAICGIFSKLSFMQELFHN